jgi:hypothetical protein
MNYYCLPHLDIFLRALIYCSSFLRSIGILERPELTNIYYISTSKTGSEWLKRVFSDKTMRYHSHMPAFRGRWVYDNLNKRIFPYTFTTSLGITYEMYLQIPKFSNYKSLYVYRDPRDILVSWYFSTLYSHSRTPKILRYRDALKNMDIKGGLQHTLSILNDTAFQSMRTWLKCTDEQVLFIGYEELIDNSIHTFRRIMEHFHWDVPDNVLQNVLNKYSFKRQAKGRRPGEEDITSHQRKAVAGDWLNYFDENLCVLFIQHNQDLLEGFNYEENCRWVSRQ